MDSRRILDGFSMDFPWILHGFSMVGAIGHPSLPGRCKSLPGTPKTLSGSIRTFSWAQGLFEKTVRPPKTVKNHEHHGKFTHMAPYVLTIRLFEAHSLFLSIANPPRPQISPENFPNPCFPNNPKVRTSEISLGVGGNGWGPFKLTGQNLTRQESRHP